MPLRAKVSVRNSAIFYVEVAARSGGVHFTTIPPHPRWAIILRATHRAAH